MLSIRSNSNSGPSVLDAAVAGSGLVPAFQPIVSLADGLTVGFEALARWPNLADPSPQPVIDYAMSSGQIDVLDRACIDAAVRGALAGGLPGGSLLLVNCEPASPYTGRADDDVMAQGHDELTLMFEFTERDLLAHPRTVLRKVAALRADGFTVALDDIGVHPDSLALLDVICPDVVKLDIDLIQTQPRYDQARTLSAVLAHHERTGAVILAEGIETENHLEQALAMGATLGQGYRYGRAASLDGQRPSAWSPPVRADGNAPAPGSPFELVSSHAPIRTARKQTLNAFTRHIESQAARVADPPMVLSALQRGDHFTALTEKRYRELAETCPLVAVFAENLPENIGSKVRRISLNPADLLCLEWTVVVLGPHHCVALLARELTPEDDRPMLSDMDRLFEFAITYDRELVTVAARNMLDRMV